MRKLRNRIYVFLAALIALLPQVYTAAGAQSYIQASPSFVFTNYTLPFESSDTKFFTRDTLGIEFDDDSITRYGTCGFYLPISKYDFSGSAILQYSFTFSFDSLYDENVDSWPMALYLNYVSASQYTNKTNISHFDSSGNVKNRYEVLSEDVTLYVSRTNTSSGDGKNNVISYSLTFILGSSFANHANDIYVDFYFNHLYSSSTSGNPSFYISSAESSVILVDSSYDDLQSAVNAIASDTSGISTGIDNIVDNVKQGNDILKEDVVNSIDDVQESVDYLHERMPNLVEEGTSNALDEHDKQLYEENTSKFEDNVSAIYDNLPLVDDLYDSLSTFESLYDIVSSESTDCSVTLPAGDVSIAGQSYHFWDETLINLNPIFENEHITLLLVAVRFSFGVAFLWTCVNWCNKIISLVLMEDTANVHMEMQQDIRSESSANGYTPAGLRRTSRYAQYRRHSSRR